MCSDRQDMARGPRRRRPVPSGRRRAAFSLIEVMVVVVIIGLLAGTVVLRVTGYMDTAKVNRTKSDIGTIERAIEAFYLEHSRYPTNQEGLTELPIKTRLDPWGNPYQYNSPGQKGPFEIVSFGADGQAGGDGMNADIYSWQVAEVDVEE